MNDLRMFFDSNEGGLIHKWEHYFDIYEQHFSRYRGTDVHVVEFGVFQGGSLQMWKQYFGDKASVFGIDINPACKALKEDQIQIVIGDQGDRTFLRSLRGVIPRIDILIDDGGHRMEQQIRTFEELYPAIDDNGIYLCEDMHTSYRRGWGGGYRHRGSFAEYSKTFIDSLNAWHCQEPEKLSVTDFTKSTYSLHYYDSILVIEKKPKDAPFNIRSGVARLPDFRPPKPATRRLKEKLKRVVKRVLGRS